MLLETEGVHVEFTDDAVDEIAEIAFISNESNENIGARRLHTVMEKLIEAYTEKNSGADITLQETDSSSGMSALACTTIYVGSEMSADGSTMFARSEDISNSYNKIFYVSPAGNHTAGEEYSGCYGFTYTFEKDSYSYTAFRDDNGLGECPDCGGTHAHTPYEAGGTNEMGLTVSATETLSGGSKAVKAVDPFNKQTGIEEAEIPTVLLSECATAREAVAYLNAQGEKVGYLQVHLFNPFSKEFFLKALPKTVKKIAVLDRCKEMGADGDPLYLAVCSAFINEENKPFIIGGRYGLSSKDTHRK
jgi:hypothetical protein